MKRFIMFYIIMFYVIMFMIVPGAIAQKALIDTGTVLIDTFRVGADTHSVVIKAQTNMTFSINFSKTEADSVHHLFIFEMSDDTTRWAICDSARVLSTHFVRGCSWYDYTLSDVPRKKWLRVRSIAEALSYKDSDNILTMRKSFWYEWK